ncbi:MAG: hypothetical protein V1838_05570 [Patescibacteria group bacterium]
MKKKEGTMSHLWLVLIQIAALILYVIGSQRFYRRKRKYLRYNGLAILLDILIVISIRYDLLPVKQVSQEPFGESVLFKAHVILASFGMLSFIIAFFYILLKGINRSYPLLKFIMYRVILPVWCLGVSIALLNYLLKVFFSVSLYNYF